MFLHVKLVDVHEDGRAHALLFGQQVVDEPGPRRAAEVYLGHTGYRLRRGTGCACRWRRATFPVFLPHPGSAENPWDATATRTNLQTLAAGGETPSYLSLTVLRGER